MFSLAPATKNYMAFRLEVHGTCDRVPEFINVIVLQNTVLTVHTVSKVIKGKVHPRTGHESPKGEQIYNSTRPSTSALDRGGRSTPRPGRFTPEKDSVPIV